MKFVQAELSFGAKALFERLLPQAVLFHMPDPDPKVTPGLVTVNNDVIEADNFAYSGKQVLMAALDWCKNGVLPFPLTATTFTWKHPTEVTHYTETTVAWLTEGYVLNFVYKLDIFVEKNHTELYGIFAVVPGDEEKANLSIRRPDPQHAQYGYNHGKVSYREWVKSEGVCSMYRLIHLFKTLESVEHTASQRTISRHEARATGQPRTQWTIHIRKRGSRGVPSMKEQFASIVKAAHAVRAHHRQEHLRQYKDGHITVVAPSKVRAHIRGQGGAIQFKDYLVEA